MADEKKYIEQGAALRFKNAECPFCGAKMENYRDV